MEIALPVIVITSIFYLSIACIYDMYLRNKFIYIKKKSFNKLYVSRDEANAWKLDEETITSDSVDDIVYLEAIGQVQPIITLSMNGDIISANLLYANMLGITQYDLVGKSYDSIIDPVYTTERSYTQLWESLDHGEGVVGEYKLLGIHGRSVWIDAVFTPIKDENGNLHSVVCLAKDITDKKFAINNIKRQLMSLADGELTSRLNIDVNGELKAIVDTVNELVTKFNTLFRVVNDSSSHVYDSAREVSATNEQLCVNLESQTSNVQVISSAIDTFMDGIKNYTVEVNASTKKTDSIIAKLRSNELTDEKNIANMEVISGSVNEIAIAVNLLDDIAFETNLLALNAAVEAAGAGEKGQGFAIVASDLRNLASRCAEVVQGVKILANDNKTAVEKCEKMMGNVDQGTKDLVSLVKEVEFRLSRIDSISKEQEVLVNAVSQAIAVLKNVTNKNNGLVEQSVSHSQTIKERSHQLTDQVAFFGPPTNNSTLRNKLIELNSSEEEIEKIVVQNKDNVLSEEKLLTQDSAGAVT